MGGGLGSGLRGSGLGCRNQGSRLKIWGRENYKWTTFRLETGRLFD